MMISIKFVSWKVLLSIRLHFYSMNWNKLYFSGFLSHNSLHVKEILSKIVVPAIRFIESC